MKIKTFAFLICIFFQSLSFAKSHSMIVKEKRDHLITKRNVKHIGGTYIHSIEKLIMFKNSKIVITDYFAGKKLLIRINEFIGSGNNTIIQPFSSDPDLKWAGYTFSHDYHPSAENGKKGNGNYPETAAHGDHGKSGGRGTDGENGRSSVELTVEMGIRQVEDLEIVLLSESGGQGGSGGDGQHGGWARCTYKDGGDGGIGGQGGQGGKPGKVGPVIFKWWELSPVIHSEDNFPLNVTVHLIPGANGLTGNGGRGGNAGRGRKCLGYKRSGGSPGPKGPFGKHINPEKHFFLGSMLEVRAEKLLK